MAARLRSETAMRWLWIAKQLEDRALANRTGRLRAHHHEPALSRNEFGGVGQDVRISGTAYSINRRDCGWRD